MSFFWRHFIASSSYSWFEMNPQVDKVVRRTTMVATAVASYLLLTADYGPEPNALDPLEDVVRRTKIADVALD
ncbi:hypothetical protein DY000_02044120 [Brassica cretica]|nr:hypothetical protein DY000_02044120 [Brassica cretica]